VPKVVADSVEATGLKWAAPASGTTFSGVAARISDGDQTISNNTATAIAMDAEYYDTDGYHDNSTNNTRFTVPSGKAGYFLLSTLVEWASNGTGQRRLEFWKNGSTKLSTQNVPAVSGAFGMAHSYVVNLSVGDYIELKVVQTSGGNLDIYTFSDGQQIAMSYLGA